MIRGYTVNLPLPYNDVTVRTEKEDDQINAVSCPGLWNKKARDISYDSKKKTRNLTISAWFLE